MIFACAAAGEASLTAAGAPVVLENEHLLVAFSRKDGSMIRLRNKQRQLELISLLPKSRRPWALLLAPFDLVSDFSGVQILPDSGNPPGRVTIEWQTPHDITVKAEARLSPGSDRLELRCAAENSGNRTIIAFRYPAIQGIGPLWKGGDMDRLLHSTAMGALFHDPFHLFQAGSPVPQGRGMVVSRYPNGFHGSSLQLMAYYAESRGGFYMAAEDSRCTDKDLNFFKSPDGSLSCEIAHIHWDARPGKSLGIEYPIVIAALNEGTWYEAAERYRAWATRQPWCRRGRRRGRVARGEACRWLLEDIGAVGMWWPFRDDIRDAITRTRDLFGAPLLHLELWWKHGASREAAQSHGDRFGPFYFPHLALRGKATFNAHGKDQLVPPATPISPDWIAMCSAQPEWRTVFCETAEDMASLKNLRHHQIWVNENATGCNADCLYYDIGPCAGVPTHCYAGNHVHAPGAGRDITLSCISLINESQQRASRRRGCYIPVGTECVSEPFVGCLDFCYVRNAGFNPDMEVLPYVRQLTWLPDSRMEIVPLFPFIYHEYGPVAVQGVHPVYPWGLSGADDFFVWAEARAYLWGGLMTTFPLASSSAMSKERVRFLRGLVAARTGFARDFLAYGRMERPPVIPCGTIEIDHGLAEGGWLRDLRFSKGSRAIESILPLPVQPAGRKTPSKELSVEEWVKGLLAIGATPARNRTIRVPAVMCQAYTLGKDRLGILLIQIGRGAQNLKGLTVDPVSCGLPGGRYELRRVSAASESILGQFRDRIQIQVALPSREVILLTATRLEE